MKKRLLTIILVLTFMVTLSIPAWAEDTVSPTYGFSGFITNSVTSNPIQGVTVKATPWDAASSNWSESVVYAATTDSNGRYTFNLPEGTYRVTEETGPNWMQVSPSGDPSENYTNDDNSYIVTLPGGDSSFYGIGRDGAKTLYRLDPLTGDGEPITALGSLTVNNNVAGPNGLACDSANGLLYYTTYPGNATMYVYNLETGVQAEDPKPLSSYLSSGSETLEIACADFYDGNYYFIDGGSSGYTDDLYKVSFNPDGTISAVTKISDISGGYAAKWGFYGDIAIKDGVIYGFGKNFAASGRYEFFKVNCDGTGFEYIKSGYGFSLQLAFGADGVLYGYDLNGADYYAINLENGDLTSKAQNCGISGFNDMASGIMYYNFENEPQVHTFDETAWAATAPGETQFLSKGNWATYVTYTLGSGTQTYTLYAGQKYPVGSITVYNDDTNVYVNYTIDPAASYLSGYTGTWSLAYAHLAIASDPTGIPRTQNKDGTLGSPIPGKFADSNSTGSFSVAIPDNNNNGSVVIAAHAEMSWSGYAD